MVGPLVCLLIPPPPPPPLSFFLLYDSVPIYYETEGFSRESRRDRVGSSRPLSLSLAPSFRIHKDGGFRGTLLIYEEYEAFLRLNPQQSSSTNYREI